MDEPLSNLDAKLRVEMRRVIKELQNNLNITTIYVTHDQEEAMAISDRIAVMKQGSILQIGSPRQLYQRPANLFVATFIGRTNILEAELLINNKETIVSFKNGYKIKVPDVYDENKKNSKVLVSVRPEGFIIEKNGTEGLPAIVEDNVFLGQNTHYFVKLDTGEKIELIQESAMNEVFGGGERISLWIKKDNINLFSEDGEKNLLL
jgi:iron(III) transport system ATP-binding protein